MFGLPPSAPTEDRTPDPEPESPPPSAAPDRRFRALQRSLLAPLEATRPEPMPRIVAGVCSEREARRRPDGTLDPCPRVRCPHHLAIDLGDPEEIGPVREAALTASTAGQPVEMGRRPSLSAYPRTHGEVEQFADLVIDRLPTLPDTCELDVIARYPDGVPVEEIARVLGVTPEVVRRDTMSAAAKLFDETAADALANLEEALPRVRRATQRSEPRPAPPPVVIVRHEEREAPPPRELTAGEIFTF